MIHTYGKLNPGGRRRRWSTGTNGSDGATAAPFKHAYLTKKPLYQWGVGQWGTIYAYVILGRGLLTTYVY